MTTINFKKSIGRSPLRLAFLLIPLALGCFALSQTVRAVSPAPDGGYPGGNTAEGTQALQSLTTGIWNTANGYQTLFHDTTGSSNTATGLQALFGNTMGGSNIATGAQALFTNSTGANNIATGFQALYLNQSGSDNIANGYRALFHNTDAFNTATGSQALFSNTSGDSNNATGFHALFKNTTGVWNEAYGFDALSSNVTGRENTAIGDTAGNSITGSFNINIGSAVTGGAGENSTTRIGLATAVGSTPAQTACFIGGISGVTLASGVPVVVATNGQLGIAATSSARFKDEIKPMDKASEVILALKPVTFHYKKGIDPKGIPQFGLVAEEVEKVNPNLVTHDAKGEIYTVRYEAVNAMLLNEFLKEHSKVEKLEVTAAQQQKEIKVLTAALKEQAAQIQKVSAELEGRKPVPQLVVNEQ